MSKTAGVQFTSPTKVGGVIRQPGTVMDVSAELAAWLVDAGVAVLAEEPAPPSPAAVKTMERKARGSGKAG